ncbi:MAG: GAF domain-containing sensor histidine kinase [Flavitalea sp.]
MISPAIPLNEDARLNDLYSYDILDTETEQDFDELLQIAANIYNCPISAITFIDENRQWFKSKRGFDVSETPRNISFCGHTILENKAFIVKDVLKDERFKDNPAATDLNVRFYAGVPIVSESGFHLGAVCVIDDKPKEFTVEEVSVLTILSNQVSKLLELRRKNKLLVKQMEHQATIEKKLLGKTLQKHEDEKRDISTQLHEDIAQNLAATNFYLELAKDSKSSHDLIDESKKTISTAVKQLRKLSTTIAPTTLANLSTKYLIEDQLSSFRKKHGLEIEYNFGGEEFVETSISICIYRTIEEQLDNIVRHADASSVTVELEVAERMVFLSIKDNGKGFRYENFSRGSGLNAVLARVENLKGQAQIRSELEEGSELMVRIPIRKN